MPRIASSSAATGRTIRSLELRCPPLPETLTEARVMMEAPDRLDVPSVVESVQRDPIVLARLLHTANSVYYGLRHTVNSGDRAIGMLGPVAVTGIILGMQTVDPPPLNDGPASRCYRRIVRHSLATAFLARHFLENNTLLPAPANTASRISAGFTAGMLHDLGKLILVYNFQDEAARFYEETLPNEVDVRPLERECFGCDHTEVGEFAARRLSFPEDLVAVIRHHHDASMRPDSARLLRATAAADLAASVMGFPIASYHASCTQIPEHHWIPLIAGDQRRGKPANELLEETFGLQSTLDRFVNRLVPET